MRHRLRGAIVIFGLLLAPTASFAWGNAGHRIICEVALQRLTPQGQTLVEDIRDDIGSVEDLCATCRDDDGRNLTFHAGCIWPDESRRDTFKGTYEYHFVNVSNAFAEFDFVRDCAALDCAVVGIQRYARYLALPAEGSRGRERRVLARRFLTHFVADMHQPLHVGFSEDLGGNRISVRWDHDGDASTTPQNTNLHTVWDGRILSRAGLTSQTEDGPVLNGEITQAELDAWRDFDVLGWAAESFALAQSTAYTTPNGDPVEDDDLLSDAYFSAAGPVVREQLKKAGVRLAHLINAAADGTLPENMLIE